MLQTLVEVSFTTKARIEMDRHQRLNVQPRIFTCQSSGMVPSITNLEIPGGSETQRPAGLQQRPEPEVLQGAHPWSAAPGS